MARQIIILAALLIGMGFFGFPGMAADICGEKIATECIGCHNIDRVCEELGESEKTWNGLLKRMVAYGAELGKDEIVEMAKCFSAPSADAKAACGK
jgi:hypothetical protein